MDFIRAVEKHKPSLSYLDTAPQESKDDENFVLPILEFRQFDINFCGESLRHNLEFVKKAYVKRPEILEIVPPEIKKHPDIQSLQAQAASARKL